MIRALDGKVALVTGGSVGIGKAIAARFVAEGAQVVITGRRQAELDAALTDLGRNAFAVAADVGIPSDLDELFATIGLRHPQLDVVVANAGVGVGTVPLGQITEEQYDVVFNANVKGLIFTVQKALPMLAASASIILLGSTASVRPGLGMTLYAASKAAVRNIARCWVTDLQGSGVRVNVLSPGATLTPGLLSIAPDNQEHLLASLTDSIPLRRIAAPEEVANAALFLATNASSYVNGSELFVDGGLAQI